MPSDVDKPLLFVTSNAGKLREAREILGRPVEGQPLELEEIQSEVLREIVIYKANHAYNVLRQPLFVEDTALCFSAWGGLPGPFIKFFLEKLGSDGLVRALEPFGDFSTTAVCGVGYHDGEQVHYFEGQVSGRAVPPRVEDGFGWDLLFVPEGDERTFAEMTPQEKHAYSMRGEAIGKLGEFLKTHPI